MTNISSLLALSTNITNIKDFTTSIILWRHYRERKVSPQRSFDLSQNFIKNFATLENMKDQDVFPRVFL